ncbi:uncharacterized protein LOC142226839 [Haematobia irritans]|uniref:uncharacterized protein LOC142226839 n=1 Tax=Haematobia irritans TaxID=7368 RepID=UPI003F502AB1
MFNLKWCLLVYLIQILLGSIGLINGAPIDVTTPPVSINFTAIDFPTTTTTTPISLNNDEIIADEATTDPDLIAINEDFENELTTLSPMPVIEGSGHGIVEKSSEKYEIITSTIPVTVITEEIQGFSNSQITTENTQGKSSQITIESIRNSSENTKTMDNIMPTIMELDEKSNLYDSQNQENNSQNTHEHLSQESTKLQGTTTQESSSQGVDENISSTESNSQIHIDNPQNPAALNEVNNAQNQENNSQNSYEKISYESTTLQGTKTQESSSQGMEDKISTTESNSQNLFNDPQSQENNHQNIQEHIPPESTTLQEATTQESSSQGVNNKMPSTESNSQIEIENTQNVITQYSLDNPETTESFLNNLNISQSTENTNSQNKNENLQYTGDFQTNENQENVNLFNISNNSESERNIFVNSQSENDNSQNPIKPSANSQNLMELNITENQENDYYPGNVDNDSIFSSNNQYENINVNQANINEASVNPINQFSETNFPINSQSQNENLQNPMVLNINENSDKSNENSLNEALKQFSENSQIKYENSQYPQELNNNENLNQNNANSNYQNEYSQINYLNPTELINSSYENINTNNGNSDKEVLTNSFMNSLVQNENSQTRNENSQNQETVNPNDNIFVKEVDMIDSMNSQSENENSPKANENSQNPMESGTLNSSANNQNHYENFENPIESKEIATHDISSKVDPMHMSGNSQIEHENPPNKFNESHGGLTINDESLFKNGEMDFSAKSQNLKGNSQNNMNPENPEIMEENKNAEMSEILYTQVQKENFEILDKANKSEKSNQLKEVTTLANEIKTNEGETEISPTTLGTVMPIDQDQTTKSNVEENQTNTMEESLQDSSIESITPNSQNGNENSQNIHISENTPIGEISTEANMAESSTKMFEDSSPTTLGNENFNKETTEGMSEISPVTSENTPNVQTTHETTEIFNETKQETKVQNQEPVHSDVSLQALNTENRNENLLSVPHTMAIQNDGFTKEINLENAMENDSQEMSNISEINETLQEAAANYGSEKSSPENNFQNEYFENSQTTTENGQLTPVVNDGSTFSITEIFKSTENNENFNSQNVSENPQTSPAQETSENSSMANNREMETSDNIMNSHNFSENPQISTTDSITSESAQDIETSSHHGFIQNFNSQMPTENSQNAGIYMLMEMPEKLLENVEERSSSQIQTAEYLEDKENSNTQYSIKEVSLTPSEMLKDNLEEINNSATVENIPNSEVVNNLENSSIGFNKMQATESTTFAMADTQSTTTNQVNIDDTTNGEQARTMSATETPITIEPSTSMNSMLAEEITALAHGGIDQNGNIQQETTQENIAMTTHSMQSHEGQVTTMTPGVSTGRDISEGPTVTPSNIFENPTTHRQFASLLAETEMNVHKAFETLREWIANGQKLEDATKNPGSNEEINYTTNIPAMQNMDVTTEKYDAEVTINNQHESTTLRNTEEIVTTVGDIKAEEMLTVIKGSTETVSPDQTTNSISSTEDDETSAEPEHAILESTTRKDEEDTTTMEQTFARIQLQRDQSNADLKNYELSEEVWKDGVKIETRNLLQGKFNEQYDMVRVNEQMTTDNNNSAQDEKETTTIREMVSFVEHKSNENKPEKQKQIPLLSQSSFVEDKQQQQPIENTSNENKLEKQDQMSLLSQSSFVEEKEQQEQQIEMTTTMSPPSTTSPVDALDTEQQTTSSPIIIATTTTTNSISEKDVTNSPTLSDNEMTTTKDDLSTTQDDILETTITEETMSTKLDDLSTPATTELPNETTTTKPQLTDDLTTTTELPEIETTTVLVVVEPEPRSLPPPKLEYLQSDEGVEVFYGYSIVKHN